MPGKERGRSNKNESGSSTNRRDRRAWLVSPAAGFGGDGVKVLCQVCFEVWITVEDLFVGRIVPGYRGGTYRRSNVRPECQLCSCREGQRVAAEARRAKKEALASALTSVTVLSTPDGVVNADAVARQLLPALKRSGWDLVIREGA